MAILSTYPDDSATSADDKFLTVDNSGATKLTTAATINTYISSNVEVSNANLSTDAGEIGAAWTSWTPTFTNLSGGTLNHAKYIQIGKTVHFRWKYTLAGANISGIPTFTLPVTASSEEVQNSSPVGRCQYEDSGTNTFIGMCDINTTTTSRLLLMNPSGAYLYVTAVSATIPHTWASGDIIFVRGTYEAYA